MTFAKGSVYFLLFCTIILISAWLITNTITPEVAAPVVPTEITDAYLVYNNQENVVEIVKDSNATLKAVATSGYSAIVGLVWGLGFVLLMALILGWRAAKKQEPHYGSASGPTNFAPHDADLPSDDVFWEVEK